MKVWVWVRQRVRKVFFLNPAPMMTSLPVPMTQACNLFPLRHKDTAWLPDPLQALTWVSYKVPKQGTSMPPAQRVAETAAAINRECRVWICSPSQAVACC